MPALTLPNEGKERIKIQDGEAPFYLYKDRPPRKLKQRAKLPYINVWRSPWDTVKPVRRLHPHEKIAEIELDGLRCVCRGDAVDVQWHENRNRSYQVWRAVDGGITHNHFQDVPSWVRDWADKHLLPWNRDLVLRRYPRVVAHVIAYSLGYATPNVAASIVAAALNDRLFFCEWINACHSDDPVPAVFYAIKQRKMHRGAMADYRQALVLVCGEMLGYTPHDMLASWF